MANKLTAKQMAFARCMASGTMTQSAAYRETYSAGNMSGAVVRNEASRLMANHDIAIMVERLIGDQERALLASGLSDRDKVLERLRHFIEHGQADDSMKIRATELLGKSCGLFRDGLEVSAIGTRDAESVASEIERRLGSLLTASQEQESEQVIPSENDSLH